jgi:hypothetical protein
MNTYDLTYFLHNVWDCHSKKIFFWNRFKFKEFLVKDFVLLLICMHNLALIFS